MQHDRRSFDGVKVFSGSRDRERIGELATAWLRANPVAIVDIVITQSSDREFHCYSISIFYRH